MVRAVQFETAAVTAPECEAVMARAVECEAVMARAVECEAAAMRAVECEAAECETEGRRTKAREREWREEVAPALRCRARGSREAS